MAQGNASSSARAAALEAALADGRQTAEVAAVAAANQLAAKQAEADDLATELAAVKGQLAERVQLMAIHPSQRSAPDVKRKVVPGLSMHLSWQRSGGVGSMQARSRDQISNSGLVWLPAMSSLAPCMCVVETCGKAKFCSNRSRPANMGCAWCAIPLRWLYRGSLTSQDSQQSATVETPPAPGAEKPCQGATEEAATSELTAFREELESAKQREASLVRAGHTVYNGRLDVSLIHPTLHSSCVGSATDTNIASLLEPL